MIVKIILIGTVEFSKKVLEKLIGLNKNVVGVLTKEISAFNSDFTDLSIVCREHHLDFRYVKNINDTEIIEYIKSKQPDVIFCFGWSQLIKQEILNIPKIAVIGYHPALLPQNRGRHPLIWALVLGLHETGVSFFFMDEGADSGDILSQRKVEVSYQDDARTLYDKTTESALSQIEEFLPLLEKNTYQRIKQRNLDTNYWRKRSIKDGIIDWRMSSNSIYNLVRALTRPYIGSHFVYNGKDIKVWKVEEIKDFHLNNIEAGKILKVYSSKSFLIKTGELCIKVCDCDLKEPLEEGDYL